MTASDTETPVRVLFIVGSPPFHDIVNLPSILDAHLARHGGFVITRASPPPGDPENSQHLEILETISADEYDTVLFYVTVDELQPAQEKGLRDFLLSGGGVVALHGSSASFRDSQLWGEMLGGRFIGHPPGTARLRICIADRSHPITAGVDDFEIIDEEYCHVLPTTIDRHVLGRFASRPPTSECPDGPDEMMWVRTFGEGRVFYNALGHDANAWQNESWQRLVRQGLLWVARRA